MGMGTDVGEWEWESFPHTSMQEGSAATVLAVWTYRSTKRSA